MIVPVHAGRSRALSRHVLEGDLHTSFHDAERRDPGFRHAGSDGIVQVSRGGIGDKRAYDPRAWGRHAEQAMATRVVDACPQLGSAGRSLTGR